jgi:hypothetical protein
MDEALKALGFTLTVQEVAGFPKKFWNKGDYWFSSCGVNAYQIVGPNNEIKKFTTTKRLPERQDQEIVEKLTAWLNNPTF